MRLRSLLLGIMITGAFVACSDDDVEPINPTPDGAATLFVQTSNVKTKALGDEKVDDKFITNLSVLVFNGTGNDAPLEIIGNATSQSKSSLSEVKDIAVSPGNKQIIVIANLSAEQLSQAEVTVGKTYSNVINNSKLLFSKSEANGTLSMNSKVYKVSLEAGKINYLGYASTTTTTDANSNYLTTDGPVYLYRNVSKAVIKNITIEPLDRYPGATLDLKEVFILHGHQYSQLIGKDAAQWGTTNITGSYFNGATNAEYAAWVKYMEDYKNKYGDKKRFNYILDSTPSPYEAFLDTDNTFKESYSQKTITEGGGWDSDNDTKSFYIYENTNIGEEDFHTLLVVKGDFSYQGVDEDGNDNNVKVTSKDRYYTVALGLTGIDKGGYSISDIDGLSGLTRDGKDKFFGALRNLQYSVSMTIKGPGYTTPFGPDNVDDTFMGVQVQVVPLKMLHQKVDVGGE